MNYSSDVQNTQTTENFSYTPYMIKPSNSNSSGYVSYIDLLKFVEAQKGQAPLRPVTWQRLILPSPPKRL